MNKIAKAHKIFFDKTGIEVSVSIDRALREILKAQREDLLKQIKEMKDKVPLLDTQIKKLLNY